MTPLIGENMERLGYDATYTLRPGGAPLPAPRWEDALDWQGTALTTTVPVVIDVGAAGKGQLADLLSAQLRDGGCAGHFIDASGDLLNPGPDPVVVALEHPYDPTGAIGTVQLEAGALCASAANRRAWGDGFHHVLDGTTGAPVRTVVASWAMAGTAMVADALATALFFVDGPRLEQEFDCAWLTVYADGHAEYSANSRGPVLMTAITTTALGSRLDTALGRLTMYRLVLWVLAILAGYSLLLNVLGWLTFGLPEMLAHLALCLGLTYASSQGLAALFHVRPPRNPHSSPACCCTSFSGPASFSGQPANQGLQLAEIAGVALACDWPRPRSMRWPGAAGTFQSGRGGRVPRRADRAQHCHLVGRDAGHARRCCQGCWCSPDPCSPGRRLPVVAVSIVAADLLQAGMNLPEALWRRSRSGRCCSSSGSCSPSR